MKTRAALVTLTEREGTLREKIRFFCRFALLIVDEIGYLPVIPGGGSLFFQLVNARFSTHQKNPTRGAPGFRGDRAEDDRAGKFSDEALSRGSLRDRVNPEPTDCGRHQPARINPSACRRSGFGRDAPAPSH